MTLLNFTVIRWGDEPDTLVHTNTCLLLMRFVLYVYIQYCERNSSGFWALNAQRGWWGVRQSEERGAFIVTLIHIYDDSLNHFKVLNINGHIQFSLLLREEEPCHLTYQCFPTSKSCLSCSTSLVSKDAAYISLKTKKIVGWSVLIGCLSQNESSNCRWEGLLCLRWPSLEYMLSLSDYLNIY